MLVDGIEVRVDGGTLAKEELYRYIGYVRGKNPGRSLRWMELCLDGEAVDLRYELAPLPFERIRRITGYLVGSTERWNNAKRAEEADRVKHRC